MQKPIGESVIKGASADIFCDRFTGQGWERISVHVPDELEFVIYINQQELVTILCTPIKLNYLVLGFMYSEGIISGIGDVVMMRVCEERQLIDVKLANAEYQLPKQRTLTSGCGGGITFTTREQKVDSGLVVTPKEVLSLVRQFQEQMELYRFSGGVHSSALSTTKNLLIVAEDIGRHNTLDKILGEVLLKGLSTRDRLLLTTGRVSSEMLRKAARMQIPVVISRHTPTGNAVALAHDLGIALVGVRGSRLLVYSHPERLGCPSSGTQTRLPRTLGAKIKGDTPSFLEVSLG